MEASSLYAIFEAVGQALMYICAVFLALLGIILMISQRIRDLLREWSRRVRE